MIHPYRLVLPAALATLLYAVGILPAGSDTGTAETRAAADLATRNVVLVTLDGVRVQELFAGMDEAISRKEKRSGIYDLERARRRFWRPTREERRHALMPFFWERLAPQGIVLGDREHGSRVTPLNPLLFSYPGYAEILTGQYQPSIKSNDLVRSPAETVLEFVRRRLGLDPGEVAVFGSWDGFGYAAARDPGAFFMNTGYQDVPADLATPGMRVLDSLQHEVMTLWETGRSDAVTMGLALEYVKARRPRLIYIALSESDDFAHARRYDRLLDYLNVADGFLRRLWETLEASDAYRGRTTLIVTTDHGRGRTPREWVDHDGGVPGAEDAWVAIIGPDTPDRGAVAPADTVYLADVAATLLRFFGLDFRDWNPKAGPPIAAAFE